MTRAITDSQVRTRGNFHPSDPTGMAAKMFGVEPNAVFTRKVDLSVARSVTAPEKFVATGNVIWGIAANSLAATFDLKFTDQQGDPVPFGKGSFIRGIDFNAILVSNEAQPGAYVTFLYCVEGINNINIENPLISLTEISGEVVVTDIDGAGTLASTADDSIAATATEQILAANSGRRGVHLSNPSTNAREFRVGDANVGAARGHVLPPGQSIYLETADAVSVYNPHALAQSICILQLVN